MSQQVGKREARLRLLERVDDVCLRFEDQLRAKQKPNIDTMLSTFPEPDRDELLAELLLLEWEGLYRSDESFFLEEYCRRFAPQRSTVERAWKRWKALGLPSWSTVMPTTDESAPIRPLDAGVPVELPGYEQFVLLGRGGMGEVYRAFDPRLKRLVAIKFIRAEHFSGEVRDRFELEGQALARLQHPHIAQIHSWQDAPTRPALVMEYVPGGNLEERLVGGGLSTRDSARLVAILARAVQAAHAVGIVHRDLKPANVLVAPPIEGNSGTVAGGFPKVTDFGLARLLDRDARETTAGTIMGTPMYMSPEQATGLTDQVGPASDVWALGVILYRCLSGKLPFAGDSVLETLERIKTQPPTGLAKCLPGIPCDLEQLCLRCLDKNPAQRPTAAELAQQLEVILAGSLDEPVGGLPSTKTWKKVPPRGRMRTVAVWAAVVLAGFAVVWAFRYLPNGQRLSPARTGGVRVQVRIWRPETKFQALVESLPVSVGDEVQVRFRLGGGL